MSAELAHTLLSLGERLSDPECEEVLRDCMDKEDDDGFIPYERKLTKVAFRKTNCKYFHCSRVELEFEHPVFEHFSFPQEVDGVRSYF